MVMWFDVCDSVISIVWWYGEMVVSGVCWCGALWLVSKATLIFRGMSLYSATS